MPLPMVQICLTGDFNSGVFSEKDYTDYSHVCGSRLVEHELVLISQTYETDILKRYGFR